MNRMTYFLISQRLRNGGKEQYRYRKSKFRTVLNILGYILGTAFLVLICVYGGIGALFAGFGFFGVFAGLLISMHTGKELLLTQCCIVKEQLNNDLPIDFDTKKAKWGFFLSFMPIYLIMFVATLIPGGYLWFVVYMPFGIICMLLAHMSKGFVEIFNFKMRKYNAIHFFTHLLILVIGGLIRELLILPTTL